MIVGYEIRGYDNDSHMTGSCKKLFDLDVPKCSICGYRTDYRYTNQSFKLKRKVFDFSETYDGVTIVSLKFKEFCIRENYKNLIFKELPQSPKFYQFYINDNKLEYDADVKENFCNKCGLHESIVRPIPSCISSYDEPLSDGFYQSNLWFGSGNEKSPIIIVAPITLEKLKREGFKNMNIEILKNYR